MNTTYVHEGSPVCLHSWPRDLVGWNQSSWKRFRVLKRARVFKIRMVALQGWVTVTPSFAEAGRLQVPALRWTYKFESADSPSAETPTTPYCVISCRRNCRKTGAARALVKMSACWSFVDTHLSSTSPCSTDSVTK